MVTALHRLLVALRGACCVLGHSRRRGGTGSHAAHRGASTYNHCAPSDLPPPEVTLPLRCCATQHRAAQGPCCPGSLSPREQEALVYLLASHKAV